MSQINAKSKHGKTVLFGYDRALGFFFDKYDDPFEINPSLELSTLRNGLDKKQLLEQIEKWLLPSEKIRLQNEILQVLDEGKSVNFLIPNIDIQYSNTQLLLPEARFEVAHLSPSFGILEKLLSNGMNLDSLDWREFEKLVAELLQRDGYSVELGPGRNDGGKDLIATKNLGESGLFKAVWQAKLKKTNNKVGLSVIRELADTRLEQGATKGILVTSTYLTRGALNRVQRDEFSLGKVDRDDLMKWIDRVLQNRP